MRALRSVIVLAPLFPWPPHDGGRIGILYRLRELCRHGIRARLAYTYLPSEQPCPSPLDGWCSVVAPFARPKKGSGAWRAWRLPYGVGSRYIPGMRAWLTHQIAIDPPDVVHLEQTQMGVYRHDIPAEIPVVLGVHNLEYRTLAGRANSIGPSLRGLAYHVEGQRMRRYENRLFREGDWSSLLFVSQAERLSVEAAFPRLQGRCADLPPGCDPPKPPSDIPFRALNLAFLGALWFENNTEGLVWFIREVWPPVLSRVPAATLTVAGHGASATLEQLLRSAPGVRYLGFVPEVQPVYDGARGIVLPIRVGGGVKVKTVEALGTGVPCVGTRHAYEGIPSDLSGCCVSSDDPGELVEACVRVLNADGDMLAMGLRARRVVNRDLSWTAVGGRYVEALSAAADGREPGEAARIAPTARKT